MAAEVALEEREVGGMARDVPPVTRSPELCTFVILVAESFTGEDSAVTR